MGHSEVVMQRTRRGQNNATCAITTPHSTIRGVGNPFAHTRKFSGKTASTRRKMISKKGARRRPFRVLKMPHSRRFLARQLALGELERLARLGAAVLLALDHARVAREKAAFFQNATQIRLEIG